MQSTAVTITSRQMLTEHVMEFVVATEKPISILPGQRALFVFENNEGTHERSYTIVDHYIVDTHTYIQFALNITTQDIGSTTIRKTAIGETLYIKGIFGNFSLQATTLPKVFIGTGMGILPLISLAKSCSATKRLFFSVSHKKDLFYEDKIQSIPGLGYEIYLSQEDISGYKTGRIHILNRNFSPTTEFYISGKGETIQDISRQLAALGYKRIYTETL